MPRRRRSRSIAINLDLASVDYFGGRASLWATLDIRSGARATSSRWSVLGFDETFLRPVHPRAHRGGGEPHALSHDDHTREPASRAATRRRIHHRARHGALRDRRDAARHGRGGLRPRRRWRRGGDAASSLPRTDRFLRAFVKIDLPGRPGAARHPQRRARSSPAAPAARRAPAPSPRRRTKPGCARTSSARVEHAAVGAHRRLRREPCRLDLAVEDVRRRRCRRRADSRR